MENPSIFTKVLFIVSILLILVDAAITKIGLSRGFQEANNFVLQFGIALHSILLIVILIVVLSLIDNEKFFWFPIPFYSLFVVIWSLNNINNLKLLGGI